MKRIQEEEKEPERKMSELETIKPTKPKKRRMVQRISSTNTQHNPVKNAQRDRLSKMLPTIKISYQVFKNHLMKHLMKVVEKKQVADIRDREDISFEKLQECFTHGLNLSQKCGKDLALYIMNEKAFYENPSDDVAVDIQEKLEVVQNRIYHLLKKLIDISVSDEQYEIE